ncbi:hypothetical protein [Croceibacterium ferulae]|uniref:hypothetical protein n=1 Tax=Croceibacterium ferulae TaxID=1854641 RepID=UPI000EACB6A2|nr:hypothetical protein [Croceibacterium ferulae]
MMISLFFAAASLLFSPPKTPVTLEEVFSDCWERQTVRYASTDKRADDVVAAALAACEAQRRAHRVNALRGVKKSPRLLQVQAGLLDQWEAYRRGQMQQRVLAERQRA